MRTRLPQRTPHPSVPHDLVRSSVALRALGAVAMGALSLACGPSAPQSPSPPAPIAVEPVPAPSAAPSGSTTTPSAVDAAQFMTRVDAGLRRVWTAQARADWINQTYITEDTDSLAADAQEAAMAYVTEAILESRRYDGVEGIAPDVARRLALLRRATVLPAPTDPASRKELAQLGVSMQSAYGKGKHCSEKLRRYRAKSAKDDCLTLGELSKVLEDPKASWDELVEAFEGWRNVGTPLRAPYERFVGLGNEGARAIGYADLGALWRDGYDMRPEELEADVERLWAEVRPLYSELHCFAASRLRAKWGAARVPEGQPIPAHLLGNMWSQSWGNIYPLLEPYANKPSLDVTRGVAKKKLDSKAMVRQAESFFVSLGLPSLPKTFWERSMFDKPRDREVVCHASAWDLTLSNDIRIKMCTEPNEEDLVTIHHELGHNYYFTAYHQLSALEQQGANDGFHEGIGDTIALSVTPDYLAAAGLLSAAPSDPEAELNVLMRRALDKVAFLPFGLLIDRWRWGVFRGEIQPSQYNAAWWKLVRDYQGVAPPSPRDESFFDPGAKYHVPANTPYLRYFLAHIYQFQFHRALCRVAGHSGPLHRCSIAGSKKAGEKLWAMLQLGASRPWPDAMEALSGERRADASAMLEYFAPLREYLRAQNQGKRCSY
jgi:peptidyl-dipeptidase A